MQAKSLSRYFDHTLLKANATDVDIKKLCDEANDFNFFSVCINPAFVTLASRLLKDSEAQVCTVIDFPLGAGTLEDKIVQTKNAILNGASEIDMVLPLGLFKDKKYDLTLDHIKAVVKASDGHTVKVIIETALLTRDEKIKACELVSTSGAHFIKTSTGFSTSGAQLDDIALFKEHLDSHVKIKASGGIKNYDQALAFINSGCDRLGVSSSLQILEKANQ